MRTKNEDFDWSFGMVLVWSQYLTNRQITPAEFAQARAKSFDLEWQPNNALEFLSLVRKKEAKPYPTAEDAFQIACSQASILGSDIERDWKHPVVLETANRIGWNKLKTCTNGYEPTFKKRYAEVVAEFEDGADFVIPETDRLPPPEVVDIDEIPSLSSKWDELKRNLIKKDYHD